MVSTAATVSVSGLDTAGNAVEGSVVTAALTDPTATNVTYQWLDNGVAISGATGSTYTPGAGDIGKALDVVVSFTDGGVNEQMTALGGTVAALVPVITAASTQTIGVGQDTTISGISLAETGNTTGETFTVVLSDTNGVLSATAVGDGDTVTSTNSGTTLTITGSLSDVNADLATLTDNNGTPGSDPITITATDSFNNTAASQTTTVTVADLPVIAAASTQTIGVGQDTTISGISLAETGNTTGETFTVVLSDANGVLSATAVGRRHGDVDQFRHHADDHGVAERRERRPCHADGQ